jgi:DNA-binding transcriptional MerR regulator
VGHLFKARPTRAITRISARQLDYWVEKRLVIPAKVYRTLSEKPESSRKLDFLFDFDNLVQLRLIRSLRTAGVPLQRVREAIEKIREPKWHHKWLVHDGRDVHLVQGKKLEALSGRHRGQLGFTVVLLPELHTAVEQGVQAHLHERFDPAQHVGKGEMLDFSAVREMGIDRWSDRPVPAARRR